MPWKKHTPEQIIALLRQIEATIANGKSISQACKESNVYEDPSPLAEDVSFQGSTETRSDPTIEAIKSDIATNSRNFKTCELSPDASFKITRISLQSIKPQCSP